MTVDFWQIGAAHGGGGGAGGTVALTAEEVRSAGPGDLVVPFAEAADGALPRSGEVRISVPAFRGKALIPLLAWLAVERLALPGAEVSWYLTKNQGPDSIRRMLAEQGWQVAKERADRLVRLRSTPPTRVDQPRPRAFEAEVGGANLHFFADYGVFSPGRVDDGTALLIDVARGHPPVRQLADIGTGYGPLAVALVRAGVAGSAIGTDIDAIALWLAGRNASGNDVPLEVALTADPTTVPPTGLTVCNVPTHIDAADTRDLMAGLAARARHGSLAVVVHASLAARYTAHLDGLGPLKVVEGAEHVVLAAWR